MKESRFDPARKVAYEIQTVLVEHPVEIQAVILAQLIGAFLAKHSIEHDPHATLIMRISILHEFGETARALVASAEEHCAAGHA